MRIFQSQFIHGQWSQVLPCQDDAQWVLIFGDRELIQSSTIQAQLSSAFPFAQIVGCTTSGEISDIEIYDNTLVLTAISFENSSIQAVSCNINSFSSSFEAGVHLTDQLPKENLKHLFVLSDGQLVNGTELVNGITRDLDTHIMLSGGMAGDADRFEETLVWHNKKVESGLIVLIGFYGEHLNIGYGSLGGWDTFGPDRLITRSKGNVLYEMDDQPALDLYKKYLADHASKLPASALRFPLRVRNIEDNQSVVRTILSVNKEDKSMTFAGDVPQGAYARLMMANLDRLIDGAQGAAQKALQFANQEAEFAILISCVGRRLVLQQNTEAELESAKDVLSERCKITGFYSYGEISPIEGATVCGLHNQTMTITTFSESQHA